jgi:hypothetical protein
MLAHGAFLRRPSGKTAGVGCTSLRKNAPFLFSTKPGDYRAERKSLLARSTPREGYKWSMSGIPVEMIWAPVIVFSVAQRQTCGSAFNEERIDA